MKKKEKKSKQMITRRTLIKGAIGAGAGKTSLALFPRFSSAYKGTKNLTIFIWGGVGAGAGEDLLPEGIFSG